MSDNEKKKEDNSKVEERARYFPGIQDPDEVLPEDEDE